MQFVVARGVLEHHVHRQLQAHRHPRPDLAAPKLEARARHLVGAQAAERLALLARRYKPEDLKLVSLIATTSIVLLVRKDIPANSIDEFLAWAKGRDVTHGSVGPGSLYHILGEKLAGRTGSKMTHVPYKGGTQLITDLPAARSTWPSPRSPVRCPA